MKFDELVDKWERDSKIDIDKLDHESLRTPYLQGDYQKLYLQERILLTKLKLDLTVKKVWIRDYFLGNISQEELAEKGYPVFPRILLKSDVDLYVDADSGVITALGQIAVTQAKVDFLNMCVESLAARRWVIKNTIDYLKFKHGIT